MNFYNPSEEDIEISSSTKIDDDIKASFPYVSDIMLIKNILADGKNGQKVSLVAYIKIDENRPPIPTKIKKSGEIVNKAEYNINDNSGNMKLTVWGSKIQEIKHSGVHVIRNAVVNEYYGVISLNTNQETYFEPSDSTTIQPSKSTLSELITKTIQFPPTAVSHHEQRLSCPRCNSFAANDGKPLFKCARCGMACLANKLNEKLYIKILFGSVEVSLYHSTLKDYYHFVNKPMPKGIDQILLHLLEDDSTSLIINNRGSVLKIA